MFGSAERGKVRLIIREIIFQELQPRPRYLNVTDGRTDNFLWHNRDLRSIVCGKSIHVVMIG